MSNAHTYSILLWSMQRSFQFNRWILKEKLFYFEHWTLTCFDSGLLSGSYRFEHNFFLFLLSPTCICCDSAALISNSILSLFIILVFFFWIFQSENISLLHELMFFSHNLIFCSPTNFPINNKYCHKLVDLIKHEPKTIS